MQEGLGFFQRSLEADGSPVAAFRAVTWAYSQSGRTDDLLMECEIQRRRFDHEYVAEAGATAAWSLLRDDLMGAARATAARWLPKGAVQRLLAKNWSETGTNDLLLAAGYAAWVQRDTAAVTAIWSDANALVQAKRPTGRTLAVTSAFANRVWDNKEHLLPSLRWGADAILRSPAPIAEVDLASPFANDWLRALDERGADEATIQSALRAWATGRPDSPEPLVALAEFLARTGRAAAALTAIDAALRLAPDDERILARRLAIARVHYADGELGGPALLGQCLRRGALAPEVADPIGALLCAEAAMAQSLWPIAMTSASAAVDEMPYLRAARETEVRAYLGAGRAVDAARLARRLLELLPADAAGVQLAFAAHEAAGLPIADLLFRAMPNSAPTPPLQAALLRATAEAEPDIGARFATPFALQTGSPVELRILAAQALARAGRAEAATTELTRLSAVAAELSANQRSDLLQAWVACLVASAAQQPDAALVARFQGALTDVDRVEVLRGPQGTLYGSSSMGGALRVLTAQPDPSGFSAKAETGVSTMSGGSTGYLGKAAVNLPIGDNAALRFVGSYEHISGYVDRAVPDDWFEANPDLAISERRVNDADLISGRILGMVEINDKVKITPSIWYSEVDAGGASEYYTNLPKFTTAATYPTPANSKAVNGNVLVEADLGFASLLSSSSILTRDVKNRRDLTLLFVNFAPLFGLPAVDYPTLDRFTSDNEGLVQEFRLTSPGRPARHLGGRRVLQPFRGRIRSNCSTARRSRRRSARSTTRASTPSSSR